MTDSAWAAVAAAASETARGTAIAARRTEVVLKFTVISLYPVNQL
jgi:hypothetical protein